MAKLKTKQNKNNQREKESFMCITKMCVYSFNFGENKSKNHSKRFQTNCTLWNVTMEIRFTFGFGVYMNSLFISSFFGCCIYVYYTLYKTLFRQFYAVLQSRICEVSVFVCVCITLGR